MRFLTIVIALFAATHLRGATPVILDTDIGQDVDDAFALALVTASPEIELLGITTVGKGPVRDPFVKHISTNRDEDRAWLICRFLTQIGHKAIPVAAGADPQPELILDMQQQYRRHPAAIYNRTLKPVTESAVELMAKLLKERDGIVILAIGPLTNVARLLKEHPDLKPKIARIVMMGGSFNIGYDGKPAPEAEWNIKMDPGAAKAVFASGVPLTVVPLDATSRVRLERNDRAEIFGARTPTTLNVQNLYELWNRETPVLYDPVAVAAVFNEDLFEMQEAKVDVDAKSMTVVRKGPPNARVATGIKKDAFLKFFVERLKSSGKEVLPRAVANPSKLIEPGNFPARVHTFEDYDTDIEKRWWMCGKPETKDLPPGGVRAFRAVLTQDFDDKQGDRGAMYRAVIFNPVPGPPMGPNTRLRFRFKISGTDTMRVQLYSLSNGYHRYLSLSGLDQGKWLDGCVDMIAMRRPDGSGGPLAANERIDDIQFYIDPRAELLIDDVVLYDAASEKETRPFPKRILYTGWFDSGKQGKEWPGDFEIVNHDPPRGWKHAKSVPGPDGKPWLRFEIRGARKLDATTELTFKYQSATGGQITIELFNRKSGRIASQTVTLAKGDWAEAKAAFEAPRGALVDEIRFLGDVKLDDVLLYVP